MKLLQAIDKPDVIRVKRQRRKLGKLADPIFQSRDRRGESEADNCLMASRTRIAITWRSMSALSADWLYTGIVFEAFDRAEKFRAIAGVPYDT